MKMLFGVACLVLAFLSFSSALGQETGFTQEDRERLVRLEATLQVFMQQVDKRFEELREDMNKRFEQIDKRFEQIDKRFEQVDKRFEQVDKRFEDVRSRFEQLTSFLWILVAIFTTLTAVVIGFAYWDRRTIVRKARDEAVEAIEKEGRLRDLIHALRRLASDDPKLAEVLRTFRIL